MQLQVLDIGATAHRLLAPGQRGVVLAAVSRTIYLLGESGGLFWLTTAEIPRHPRCVRVSAPLPGVAVNTPFAVNEPGLLTVGPDIHLDCRQAPIWHPPMLSAGEVLPPVTLPERVRAAAAVLENLPSPTGLGTLLPEILSIATGDPPSFAPTGAFSTLALPAIREIARAWLAHDGRALLSGAESLVGLGEGLTPSGDDFVGGLLFCLYWLSRLYGDGRPLVDGADATDRFSDKTNPISFALLSDLAKGQGVEPLHLWLRCVLTDSPTDQIRKHSAQLVQMGHSSGWDLLSGALTGLHIACQAYKREIFVAAAMPPQQKFTPSSKGVAMDIKQEIEKANEEAVRRIIEGEPVLVDIAPAGEVIPGMEGKMVTHAGPPIPWREMCGAMKGAIIGQVLYEGWAQTVDEAVALLEKGAIRLEPNHHHQTVGPMAGAISPSAPVWVVENRTFGNRAFCRQVESHQQFGNYSEEALQGLRMWRDLWAPTLRKALHHIGGLNLKPIIAQALQMGDELHNRHTAASSLFANAMAVAMVEADIPKSEMLPTLKYVTNHNLIFLGLAMAAAKAIADPAMNIPYSTVVTAMCRNGVEFGIRVSGLGEEWFTAPAPVVDGLYLPGYSAKDAGLDMGDSAITETVGWGAFTLGGAPGILSLVGGTPEEAMAYSQEMRKITVAPHPIYRMPIFNFTGIPVGIDIRKVVQTGITPIIDTAIAHKEPGHSIIGAGLVRAPLECFKKALIAFGRKYQVG